MAAASYQYDEEQRCPHHSKFCTAALSAEKPTVWHLYFKRDDQHLYQKQQRERAGEKADCDANGSDRFDKHYEICDWQRGLDSAAGKNICRDALRAERHELWPYMRQ